MKILITGTAGFIGYHLVRRFLNIGFEVIGIDCISDYYDINLKKSRLKKIENSNFLFFNLDISNKKDLDNLFKEHMPDYVINLAAQAGVRYSIENPYDYLSSNIIGFLNILEGCKTYNVKHLIYASSSSVYGANNNYPFKEDFDVTKPLSFYAATKVSNEAMAYSYSNIFKLKTTGLRFFTVYGPWGRPDMAYFIFTKNIMLEKPIKIFGNGNMLRDFTYIDDIINGITDLFLYYKDKDEKQKEIPWDIFNIGNNNPIDLKYFIEVIEKNVGKKAIKIYEDIKLGDVFGTAANIDKIAKYTNFEPKTNIEDGIKKFVLWYKSYYEK